MHLVTQMHRQRHVAVNLLRVTGNLNWNMGYWSNPFNPYLVSDNTLNLDMYILHGFARIIFVISCDQEYFFIRVADIFQELRVNGLGRISNIPRKTQNFSTGAESFFL